MPKQKHIEFLTITKGILIILVVLGHSNVPFRNFIYLFHVAAFFFISGVFYKKNYVEKPLLFVYKKIKTLYLPFIIYSTVFICLHNFFVHILLYSSIHGTNNERNFIYNFSDYVTVFKNVLTFGSTEQLLVSFWFITALFTISILMIFLDVLLKRFKTKNSLFLFIIILLFSIGMLFSHFKIELPRFINVSLVSLLIFYSGFRVKEKLVEINFNFVGALCCFIVLILNSYYGNQEMVTNRYPDPAFFILNSFVGIYLIIYIAQLATKTYLINKFLTYVGNNSLHVLALHCLAFKLTSLMIIYIYNYPLDWLGKFFTITERPEWWPVYGFVGVVVPLISVYFFQNTLDFIRKFSVYRTYEKRSH